MPPALRGSTRRLNDGAPNQLTERSCPSFPEHPGWGGAGQKAISLTYASTPGGIATFYGAGVGRHGNQYAAAQQGACVSHGRDGYRRSPRLPRLTQQSGRCVVAGDAITPLENAPLPATRGG